MDLNQIVQLLQATFSQVNTDRRLAEEHLSKLETAQGFSVILLQIVNNNEIDINLRQSASIALKKLVRNHWELLPSEDPNTTFIIPEQDKVLLKANLVDVLIHAPEKVRSQIGVCIRDMVQTEYPQKWPELIPKIMQYLGGSKDPHIMQGALVAIRETIKRYEYVQPGKNRRKPLNELVANVFPVLLQLLNALLPMKDVQAGLMIKTILKAFWAAVNYGIPPYLLNDTNFLQWMTAFLQLIEKDVPEEGQPTNPEEKPSFSWWKAKKWVVNILARLYSRYGDIKLVDDKAADVLEFSKRFSNIYAPKLLEAYLNLLNNVRTGKYLPDQIIYSALGYINTSLRHNNVYAKLKPHVDVLFTQILFPLVCFNESDKVLWEEDPQEYMRRDLDIIEEYYVPKAAAINVLVDLARLRGKNHLPMIMAFLANILNKYATDANKNPSEKFGALYSVGALGDKLIKMKEYAPQLETLLQTYVIPEFTSPIAFLRERAIWVFTQFYDIEFTNPQIFLNGLSQCITCLRDQELPVKIRAGLSMRFLIRNPLAREPIGQILPTLLEEYFRLMNEMDNDEIVSSLEELIDQYEDRMAPYAVTLCQKMSETFLRMIADPEDESAIAAMEVLTAIQTILRSICEKPELYLQVEPILAPLILKIMDPDVGLEFFEESIKLCSYFTYYAPGVSEFMWSLFPKMVQMFEEYSMDLITDLLVPFDNYISRGTNVFLTGPYLEMVFTMYKKVMVDDNCEDRTVADAAKLWEVVLQNCIGKVDQYVEPALELALARLTKTKKPALRVLLMEIVANTSYYNPALLLAVLEKRGWTKPTFEYWFQTVPHLERVWDKKLTIVGLSNLFALPFDSLPAVVKGGSKQILVTLLKLIHDSEVQKHEISENLKKAETQEDEVDSQDEEDYELDEHEEKDVGADLIARAKEAAKYYQDENEDDDLDYDDDLEDFEDEAECTSPLDDIEEAIYFVDKLNELSAREPNTFNGLLSQLDPVSQDAYKTVAALAEKKRVEILQKKAAQANNNNV